jgi:hypothetical protein
METMLSLQLGGSGLKFKQRVSFPRQGQKRVALHFVLYSLSLYWSLSIAVSIQHVLRAGSCNNTQESPPSDLDPLGAHNPIQIGESEVSREVVVSMNPKHAGLRDENNAESLLLLAVGRTRPVDSF